MSEEKSPFVVILIVGIIGVLFILMFFLPYFFGDQSTTITDADEDMMETIGVLYQYKDGIHKYKGALNMPTPCHALRTQVVTDDVSKEQITLSFEAVSTAPACAKAVTPQTFMVAFAASEDVSISATINGNRTKLDIREIPSDQNFENF